jgi:hypothetical protein
MVGCGGSNPEAASPSGGASESAKETPEASLVTPEENAPPGYKPAPESAADNVAPVKAEEGADVKFPEGASVAEAVAAVPKGTPRSNLDTETLAEPLQDEKLWAPCKVGSQHFKLKVAVWNGRAVGVDVTTSNKALASCVEKQVRAIEWRDKVRSLNPVEYSM